LKTAFLLDINVLITTAWPTHQAHQKVQQWIGHHATERWTTCPFTETVFVRILPNPAFSPNAVTPADALALLRANLRHRGDGGSKKSDRIKWLR
jgi:predicted nucleic acid-binding protein